MEFGCIKKLCFIFLILIFCTACKQDNSIQYSSDVMEYIESENLHGCKLTELVDYYDYEIEDTELALKNIVVNSKFYIDEGQVADYSVNIVENYEYVAYLYGVSLEEYYVNILGVSEETFFQKCYDEGEYDIKYYLVIGAIAYNENLEVTESEYKEYVKKENLTITTSNEKKRVYYLIIEEKVKMYLEGIQNE